MNRLDKLISYVAPKLGYQREAWRQEADRFRNYDAGSGGRLNAGWRVSNSSAEAADSYQRDTVRARGRDLERNNDILKSVLSAMKRNVVGAGFRLQAKTDNEELNSRIEQLWTEWCKPGNCDVTGAQSFTDLCRMAVVRKKVDGGILFLKCYNSSGVLPFWLQALEVDELDSLCAVPQKSGSRVAGGIEYNKYNAPVGYYIRKYSSDGITLTDSEYIEAENVIFYWQKNRPSQIREMSDIAAAIPRIRDIGEYMTAVSVKERIAACLAVFIKRLIPSGSNQAPGRWNGAGSNDISYKDLRLTPGMIKELRPEDDIEVVNPAGQGQSAAEFVRLQQRLLSAGQGLSYETVSRDMSQVNYSSARQGLIEDEMTYTEEQQILKDRFMSEAYETFLISAVLAGRLNIPDFWKKKTEYMRHIWVPSARKWIDPVKEAKANEIALRTGQKTFLQIAAENGLDWKEQIDEMAEAIKYAEEKGVDLGGGIFGQTKETESFKNDSTAGNQGG